MGYSTDFNGFFAFDRPLAVEHREFLTAFAQTRRMRRDPRIAETLPDPRRTVTGLPIGPEGAYFVGAGGEYGQGKDASILDYNRAPSGQPGLWCQWIPSDDGTRIEWDGGEKFYHYVEWLQYLLSNFLIPWGYTLNGDCSFQGEDDNDRGVIMVRGNEILVKPF
jgi:hypothetical protein